MQFLEINNDLVITVVATILSAYVQNLIESIFVNVIKPFINIDIDNDGIPDVKNLEDFHINILNKKIYLGKVVISFIQLLIIMYSLQLIKRNFIKN